MAGKHAKDFDWIDDAFADEKPAAKGPADTGYGRYAYDWIDDAFDERKPDPLANKGMTGRSSLAVLVCGIAVVVVAVVLAFVGLSWFSLASGALSA